MAVCSYNEGWSRYLPFDAQSEMLLGISVSVTDRLSMSYWLMTELFNSYKFNVKYNLIMITVTLVTSSSVDFKYNCTKYRAELLECI